MKGGNIHTRKFIIPYKSGVSGSLPSLVARTQTQVLLHLLLLLSHLLLARNHLAHFNPFHMNRLGLFVNRE